MLKINCCANSFADIFFSHGNILFLMCHRGVASRADFIVVVIVIVIVVVVVVDLNIMIYKFKQFLILV